MSSELLRFYSLIRMPFVSPVPESEEHIIIHFCENPACARGFIIITLTSTIIGFKLSIDLPCVAEIFFFTVCAMDNPCIFDFSYLD